MRYNITFFFFLLIYFNELPAQEKILSGFESYTELPREVIYVHLNKSIFIKGENLGFNAYVFDKGSKKISTVTSNLYYKILDNKNQIIKENLLKVDNGIASGLIEIDSLFTSGDYKFIAFTNWMRNFSEKNHYQQSITIIDPEKTEEIIADKVDLKIDAQFLPESGQAIVGFESVFGVIIKNNFGFGLPYITGNIIDSKKNIVTDFKTNQFGIGQFILTPQKNKSYVAEFEFNNKKYQFAINFITQYGQSMRIQNLNENIGVTISNSEFNKTDSKNFYLTIHNGDSIKSLDINFKNKNQLLKIIPKTELYQGINVLTLLDYQEKPILERLCFNLKNLDFLTFKKTQYKKKEDSVAIKLMLQTRQKNTFGNLSISILPEKTISYGNHQNIISSTYLSPYLNGPVENAFYYFKDIDNRKKYDLDNLLLTQGWSSYNWTTVINKKPSYLFDFEKGITYTANINSNKSTVYFQYPTKIHNSETFFINENETSFSKNFFYPFDNEELNLSQVEKNGAFKKPALFVQFKPSTIPKISFKEYNLLGNKPSTIFNSEEIPKMTFESITNLQELEEVVLLKRQTNTRIERVRNKSFGKVDYFPPDDNRRILFLSAYISQNGYNVSEIDGEFSVSSYRPGEPPPVIFLDGVLLTNNNPLYKMSLRNIDYIEINKSGIGAGPAARGAGVIKIFTNPFISVESNNKITSSYKIPLTFTQTKKYYTPKYLSYSSDFFTKYGAIDWRTNITIDSLGQATFNVPDLGLSKMVLHIEGVVNSERMISETVELIVE